MNIFVNWMMTEHLSGGLEIVHSAAHLLDHLAA